MAGKKNFRVDQNNTGAFAHELIKTHRGEGWDEVGKEIHQDEIAFFSDGEKRFLRFEDVHERVFKTGMECNAVPVSRFPEGIDGLHQGVVEARCKMSHRIDVSDSILLRDAQHFNTFGYFLRSVADAKRQVTMQIFHYLASSSLKSSGRGT
ncbi:hypothetical protein SDC9_201254 [bioreactor metagenome]|uniref:Uncharacterized protein n=1 Tax=bioreactor metagenome TaxID=1076179 RepID=A0A645IRL9_9ZZZZ